MAKWWVNNPNGASVHYPSKQRAQGVARQVRGASVSRQPMGGKHSKGGWPCGLFMYGLIAVFVAAVIAIVS